MLDSSMISRMDMVKTDSLEDPDCVSVLSISESDNSLKAGKYLPGWKIRYGFIRTFE